MRNNYSRIIVGLVTFIILIGACIHVVKWIEAEKELYYLTQNFSHGTSKNSILQQLSTANYLEFESTFEGKELNQVVVRVHSTIQFQNGFLLLTFDDEERLLKKRLHMPYDIAEVASYCLISLFIFLGFFQLGLALGLPYGYYAWGGKHQILPNVYRRGSLFVVFLCVYGIILIYVLNLTTYYDSWLDEVKIYSLGAYLLLFGWSVLGNCLSTSSKERKLGIPLSVAFFLSLFILFYATI